MRKKTTPSKLSPRAIRHLSQDIMETLLYADLPFVVRNETRPDLLTIHLPGLKKHLKGRLTLGDYQAALTRLRSLRLLLSSKVSGAVCVVLVNSPRGWAIDEFDPLGRLPVSEDAFGRVPYMAASRLMKETLQERI